MVRVPEQPNFYKAIKKAISSHSDYFENLRTQRESIQFKLGDLEYTLTKYDKGIAISLNGSDQYKIITILQDYISSAKILKHPTMKQILERRNAGIDELMRLYGEPVVSANSFYIQIMQKKITQSQALKFVFYAILPVHWLQHLPRDEFELLKQQIP